MTMFDAPIRRSITPARVAASQLEAIQLNPWLAAVLAPIGDALGFRVHALPAKATGRGRPADLLVCEDDDGSVVVVKDGFVLADHGQILTRFARRHVKTIVWIAPHYDASQLDEVRRMNDQSSDEFSFYAVRVRFELAGDGRFEPLFDIMQGPPDWVPPLNHLVPTHDSGFLGFFWAFHYHRNPEEARRSSALGSRCRLRATGLKGIMIGQYVQDDAAVVFLRGREGMPFEEVESAVEPYLEIIEARLGLTFYGNGHDRLRTFVAKKLALFAMYSKNWPAISDWLRTQSDELADILSGAGGKQRRRKAA